ncbi:hypothetical protein [Rhodoflexus sp.]
MTKHENSNVFVDENGDLIRYISPTERIWLYTSAIFKALPFIAVFIICSLTIVQVACIIGLCETFSQASIALGEVLMYAFVLIISGIIQMVGLGIGWWLAEVKGLKIKVYPKELKKHPLPIKQITDEPPTL